MQKSQLEAGLGMERWLVGLSAPELPVLDFDADDVQMVPFAVQRREIVVERHKLKDHVAAFVGAARSVLLEGRLFLSVFGDNHITGLR